MDGRLNSAILNAPVEILKCRKFQKPDFINCFTTPFLIKGLELDVMLILAHFQIKAGSEYFVFSVGDILNFRFQKKALYKRQSKSDVSNALKLRVLRILSKFKLLGYIELIELDDEKFKAKILFEGKIFKINSQFFLLNPNTKIWHRALAYFLEKNNPKGQIQVKKILKYVSIEALSPYQIRERFENTLDDLSYLGTILNWHYKKIDENELTHKNWFKTWANLSIRVLR